MIYEVPQSPDVHLPGSAASWAGSPVPSTSGGIAPNFRCSAGGAGLGADRGEQAGGWRRSGSGRIGLCRLLGLQDRGNSHPQFGEKRLGKHVDMG